MSGDYSCYILYRCTWLSETYKAEAGRNFNTWYTRETKGNPDGEKMVEQRGRNGKWIFQLELEAF